MGFPRYLLLLMLLANCSGAGAQGQMTDSGLVIRFRALKGDRFAYDYVETKKEKSLFTIGKYDQSYDCTINVLAVMGDHSELSCVLALREESSRNVPSATYLAKMVDGMRVFYKIDTAGAFAGVYNWRNIRNHVNNTLENETADVSFNRKEKARMDQLAKEVGNQSSPALFLTPELLIHAIAGKRFTKQEVWEPVAAFAFISDVPIGGVVSRRLVKLDTIAGTAVVKLGYTANVVQYGASRKKQVYALLSAQKGRPIKEELPDWGEMTSEWLVTVDLASGWPTHVKAKFIERYITRVVTEIEMTQRAVTNPNSGFQ